MERKAWRTLSKPYWKSGAGPEALGLPLTCVVVSSSPWVSVMGQPGVSVSRPCCLDPNLALGFRIPFCWQQRHGFLKGLWPCTCPVGGYGAQLRRLGPQQVPPVSLQSLDGTK